MSDLRDGEWLNAPTQVRLSGNNLQVVTAARTDFWRETHYGFTCDNGHFLGIATGDGFSAQIRMQARFEHLYDQASRSGQRPRSSWAR